MPDYRELSDQEDDPEGDIEMFDGSLDLDAFAGELFADHLSENELSPSTGVSGDAISVDEDSDIESQLPSSEDCAQTENDLDSTDIFFNDFSGAGKVYAENGAAHVAYLTNESHLNNPYYPFISKMEWEIAQWANNEGPTQTAFSNLLKIQGVNSFFVGTCV